MVIIHIGYVHENPFAGVVRAVPQHVIAQQKLEDVAYINIKNIKHEEIINQFEYNSSLKVQNFPEPFNSPDIVIFHEVYHIEFIGIAKELRRLNIPYIIIPHGCLTIEAQRQKRIKKQLGNLFIFRQFINYSYKLQYLSKNEMENSFTKHSSFVVGNGVNVPERIKDTFSENRIEYVYIGRIDIHPKGLDLLFDAIYNLKDILKENNCRFSIYGPSFMNSLEKAKALVKERNIEMLVSFNPPVSGEEKETVLLGSDVFFQTSRSEGLPLGIIEALSYGIPCLVTMGTNLGVDIKEYDAGWACETTSKDIANAIIESISDRSKWKTKSINAHTLVSKEYIWENIARKAIDEYEKVIYRR